MSWNYRVIRTIDPNGDEYYGIHEVYYDDEGNPVSCTENSVNPIGESVEDLSHTVIYMMRAFTEPVLEMRQFEVNNDVEKSTRQAMDMLRK